MKGVVKKMIIKELIKVLCDGDNFEYRGIVSVRAIDEWYREDFNRKKESFFKKYRKQCKLASERMK